jgi:hypothetical protein
METIIKIYSKNAKNGLKDMGKPVGNHGATLPKPAEIIDIIK